MESARRTDLRRAVPESATSSQRRPSSRERNSSPNYHRPDPARAGREDLQVGEELDGHLGRDDGSNDFVPRLSVLAKPEQLQHLELDPVGVTLEDPHGST